MNYGEILAASYLKTSGYRILDTNYRSRFGEIDIIAEKSDKIYFFEVKYRQNINYGLPEEFINSKKIEKIKKTIDFYLSKHHNICKEMEIRAVCIYEKPGFKPEIKNISVDNFNA